MLVAFLLRFWDIANIPYTHDEFSALFRLNFESLNAFIEKGIKHDTHPAFTQGFLWLWTSIFGTTEWVVKLPFLILGTLSVALIAIIGKQWFSAESGLYSAAIFSVLQTAIFHSQTARPYAIGLFFLLLAIWAWQRYLDKKSIKHLIILGISLLLSACTHYFSLLAAGILFPIILFYSPKEHTKRLLLTGLFSLLVFIPHLPITLHQLGKGGIGTVLSAPDRYFFSNYIALTFHHSWIWSGVVSAVIIAVWIKFKHRFSSTKKYFFIAVILFLSPIVIGTVYSHLRNPVLMERSLYFTLPFLLLSAFSVASSWKSQLVNYITIILILVTGIWSLVVERKHYEIMYHSGYDYVLTGAFNDSQNNTETAVFISGVPEYLEYTCTRNHLPEDFFTLIPDSSNIEQFKREIGQHNYQKIFLGRTMQYFVPDPLYDKTLLDAGYNLSKQFNFFNSDLRLYSREAQPDLLVDKKHWRQGGPEWDYTTDRIDSSGNLTFLPEQEFGLAFSENMNKHYYTHPNRELIVSAISTDIIPDETELVVHIREGENTIYYASAKSDNTSRELNLGIRLCDIQPWHDNFELRTYIWNKGQGKFSIIDMYRIVLPGNPIQYSLSEPLYE
jgi:hypothetical protein